MDKVRFLSVEEVLQIHDDTIARDGGLTGIRDLGLLDSAVAMPRQQFDDKYLHEDVLAMAAAYLFHITNNHAFHDGNKRAAVMSAYVFMDVNGVELPDPPGKFKKELERLTVGVAASRINKDQLTAGLRKFLNNPK